MLLIAAALILAPSPARAERIVEKTARYELSVEFPRTGLKAFDAEMRRRLKDDVLDFKRRALENDRPPGEEPTVESLDISTSLVRAAGLSFLILERQGYEGGAHGYDVLETVAADDRGKMLGFKDLFSVPEGLEALSRETRDAFRVRPPEMSQDEWIVSGTTPTVEALGDVYLDGGQVVVIFNEYQVAAYAAGTVESRIDCRKLLPVMKPVLKRACERAMEAVRSDKL